MRAVCIARHRYLSDHVCSVFGAMDMETVPAVGFSEGMTAARRTAPDVVFCDYDLLATVSLQEWSTDPVLRHTPIVAVSLTRRHDEAHLFEGNGAVGFLYLPTLSDGDADSVIRAVTGRVRPPRDAMRWSDSEETTRIVE